MFKNDLFIMKLNPTDLNDFVHFGFCSEAINEGQWFKGAQILRFGVFCKEDGKVHTRIIKHHVFRTGQADEYFKLHETLEDMKNHVEYPICPETREPLIDFGVVKAKRL